MTASGFATGIDDRYFEDYVAGSVHVFGPIGVSQDEIIQFARRYDPQDMHTDPEAAAKGLHGGLIASGWHTAGLMMNLYATHYLSRCASIISPGVDELRWVRPVRPGDQLSIRVTVMEAAPSRSKPDRGIVRSFIEVVNQAGDVVMSMKAVNFLLRRVPGQAG